MNALPAAKMAEIASGGQSGVSFPAYQAWFSEISLSGDTMNALPAAKMAEIASGGRCKESYHAYLPWVGR